MGDGPVSARAPLGHDPTLSTGSQIGFKSSGDSGYMLLLPEDLWQQMDRPETITVSVEVGDLLNVEEPDAEEG